MVQLLRNTGIFLTLYLGSHQVWFLYKDYF